MKHITTQSVPFWSKTAQEAVDILKSSLEGLSLVEAERRKKEAGENMIQGNARAPRMRILARQFTSPLIFILLAAGIVTAVVGEWKEAIFILLAVGVNAALGFYQENKAEEALDRLRSYLQERVRVIRDKKEREIDVKELVPGDIIHLTSGMRVPADARVIAPNDLLVDEAVLTGEALPVRKYEKPVSPVADVAERSCVLFGGTLVVQGTCVAVVYATGHNTEFGKIATMVSASEREETPLQRSLRKFAWIIAQVLVGVIAIIVIVGVIVGNSVFDMFFIGIAMAVGAIPEGMPIALTVILAIGVERLAKRNAVVRKLVAAEALGSVTVVLTDKTGTLTEARMSVSSVTPAQDLIQQQNQEGGELKKLTGVRNDIVVAALLNSDVIINDQADNKEEWTYEGRALEVSLVREMMKRGVDYRSVRASTEVEQALPFNSRDKYSVALVKKNEKTPTFMKGAKGSEWYVFFGAPELLLERSDMKKEEMAAAKATIDRMAGQGQRMLGVAYKKVQKSDMIAKGNFGPLTFLGTIGFFDPLREGAKEAVKRVQQSGVRVAIMTGDHKGTAMAVAKELGWKVDETNVVEGVQLRGIPDEDLMQQLDAIAVFARVTPEDKMRIVSLFQKKGELVAMTGDGVNDAPSLKKADIGVAVGAGTDVSKEVADLVLLDNKFETIVVAIEEGRQIMANIKKVVTYMLSSSLDEVFLIGGSMVMGFALPLNALQILWVNFFSDSFPGIAYAFERNMDSTRRQGGHTVFDTEVKVLVGGIGVLSSVLLFGLYWLLLSSGVDPALARTVIFMTFGVYTLLVAFSLRSLSKPLFSYNPFSNRLLVVGAALGMLMMISSVYVEPVRDILGTVALPLVWWGVVAVFSVITVAAVEVVKWTFAHQSSRRGSKH